MLAVVDVCFILRKTIQTYCISTAATSPPLGSWIVFVSCMSSLLN
nr:MAG TPA: hypothetical protein [Caudoviricetes sp.]